MTSIATVLFFAVWTYLLREMNKYGARSGASQVVVPVMFWLSLAASLYSITLDLLP